MAIEPCLPYYLPTIGKVRRKGLNEKGNTNNFELVSQVYCDDNRYAGRASLLTKQTENFIKNGAIYEIDIL